MKIYIYKIGLFLSLTLLFSNCQEDDIAIGNIISPSNIQIAVEIVGADGANPNGDGSGTVHFTATADNVISFQYVYNGHEL